MRGREREERGGASGGSTGRERVLLLYLKEKMQTLCWFGGLSSSSDFNEDIFQAAATMSNVIFGSKLPPSKWEVSQDLEVHSNYKLIG